MGMDRENARSCMMLRLWNGSGHQYKGGVKTEESGSDVQRRDIV